MRLQVKKKHLQQLMQNAPFVTLSSQDNTKLLQELKSELKKGISTETKPICRLLN